MWQRERAGLGVLYTILEVTGVVVDGHRVRPRASAAGTPGAAAVRADHWRFGQLYHNPADPALFVPTRDGPRWTLNFGRPVAAALLGIILAGRHCRPNVILGLLLR